MFGIWKSKAPEVLHCDHWTFEQFDHSPSEFYASIEQELRARHVPGLTVQRVIHKEGGILSAERDYLQIHRERLLLEICFASFGDYWFVSRRNSVIPLSWWGSALLSIGIVALVAGFYVLLFGLVLGSAIFGASLIGVVLLMRNVVSLGLDDLDAALLQIPIIGPIYEIAFRKETYYRQDTRSAYCDIVNSISQAKIDELIRDKGAKLVAYRDDTPPSHSTVMAMVGTLLNLPRR